MDAVEPGDLCEEDLRGAGSSGSLSSLSESLEEGRQVWFTEHSKSNSNRGFSIQDPGQDPGYFWRGLFVHFTVGYIVVNLVKEKVELTSI